METVYINLYVSDEELAEMREKVNLRSIDAFTKSSKSIKHTIHLIIPLGKVRRLSNGHYIIPRSAFGGRL